MIPPQDRLSWDDVNMLKAIVASWRSPDPNTNVGAFLCTQNNRAICDGYNSTPQGIDPSLINWDRKGPNKDTKYPYVAHAEKNAIAIARQDLTGCKLYTTLYPCNNCAINIIQSGLKEIIYLDNKYQYTESTTIATWLLNTADVKIRQHQWMNKDLIVTFLNNLGSTLSSTK